jgi:5-guanidino-2-oxopentanoate decarboxylase
MKRPLGVQIAHMLASRGVRHVFGIPGVHNIELYRGLDEAGLVHVLARHEQGAGFMADGYARASGTPGVAFVISGPGVTNIMTPMGQAYSDSVPMLVLSSCLDPEDVGVGKGKLHEMKDQEGAAETVCDWSKTAFDAAGAYHLIDKALQEMEQLRPRPKHIQIPIRTLGAPAAAPPPEQACLPVLGTPDVTRVAAALSAATHPLFVFGGGAAKAANAAREVVQKSGAACFMTYAGRGVIAPDYPLSFGASLARPGSAQILARADLVIAVGTSLAEVDLWRDTLGHAAPLVRVDIDAEVLSDQQCAEMTLRCDAAAFLETLALTLPHDPTAPKQTLWQAKEVSQSRATWRTEIEADRPGIIAVCDTVRAALPAECHIFSDMTQFAYVAKEIWDMPAPAHWHHPFGFGTLGYALPAAIGGKVALGETPVIAIAGDYGFQYTLQELGTAVELGLSLPIIVWDNAGLGEIAASMTAAQIAPVAVTAHNPDFLLLAAAYGAKGVQPDTLEELKAAIVTALAHPGPTIIRVLPGLP